jgi:hypothetical protein
LRVTLNNLQLQKNPNSSFLFLSTPSDQDSKVINTW